MDHKTESVQNHRIFAKRKLLYNFFVLFYKKEMQKDIKRNIGSKELMLSEEVNGLSL